MASPLLGGAGANRSPPTPRLLFHRRCDGSTRADFASLTSSLVERLESKTEQGTPCCALIKPRRGILGMMGRPFVNQGPEEGE